MNAIPAHNLFGTEARSNPLPELVPEMPGTALSELLATGLLVMRPNPYHDAGWELVGLSAGPAYNFAIRDLRVAGRFARMADLNAERHAERLLADVLADGGYDALVAGAWDVAS